MKVALLIAIWKRHDLEKIVIDRFKRQAEMFGFEIIIAGSEGESSKKLAEGCHYIEVANDPVSNKHNAMTLKAKELNVDGVVVMGSDDMVNDNYWKFILSFKPHEKSIIGLSDIYFYSTRSKKIAYWKGYKASTQTAGAGRFYSRFILEKLNWKLWRDAINRGLDSSVNERYPHELGFLMSETGSFLVDIKHTRSVTKNGILTICEDVDQSIFVNEIGVDDWNKIDLLSDKFKIENIDNGRTFEPGQLVEFQSNGNFKQLEKITMMTIEQARILKNKDFGTY